MNQNFFPLLTFRLNHKYFQEGHFRTVNLIFPKTTSKLLKNLGIISKPINGGLQFYCSNPQLLENADRIHKITAYIYCTDPYYTNYTDLPAYEIQSNILYYNNLDGSIIQQGNGECILHKELYAGTNEVLSFSTGLIDINSSAMQNKPEFKNTFNEDIDASKVKRIGEDMHQYLIDEVEEGPLHIFINGDEVKRVYFHSDPLWKKPFAVADIFLNQLYKHYSTGDSQLYSINFNCRRTFWRYYLVSPEYSGFTDLSIIDKNNRLAFKRLSNDDSDLDAPSLIFQSAEGIDLSDHYTNTFHLVDQFNEEDETYRPVIKGLPYASVEQLFKGSDSEDKNMYSHIYI